MYLCVCVCMSYTSLNGGHFTLLFPISSWWWWWWCVCVSQCSTAELSISFHDTTETHIQVKRHKWGCSYFTQCNYIIHVNLMSLNRWVSEHTCWITQTHKQAQKHTHARTHIKCTSVQTLCIYSTSLHMFTNTHTQTHLIFVRAHLWRGPTTRASKRNAFGSAVSEQSKRTGIN